MPKTPNKTAGLQPLRAVPKRNSRIADALGISEIDRSPAEGAGAFRPLNTFCDRSGFSHGPIVYASQVRLAPRWAIRRHATASCEDVRPGPNGRLLNCCFQGPEGPCFLRNCPRARVAPGIDGLPANRSNQPKRTVMLSAAKHLRLPFPNFRRGGDTYRDQEQASGRERRGSIADRG